MPKIIATDLRGWTHNHCDWAHKGCNWDRNHRGRAHTDCNGGQAGRGRQTTGLLPGRRTVSKATWQASISGIEPGQNIYGKIRLFCTGFLTIEGQHADRLRAGFDR